MTIVMNMAAAVPETGSLPALLARAEASPALLAAAALTAVALGAAHALSPGHGKSLVAAYLVGSRGTMRHAALLGLSVTVTHTASVFAVGVATLFLSRSFSAERIYPVLSVVSGLSIFAIGGWLLVKRIRRLRQDYNAHHHDHAPPEEITLPALIALGASGGLVPCPSAMVLLLTAVSLRRVGAGLVLLTAFSLGLALVLVAIGAAVLYAQDLLPATRRHSHHPVMRYLPVVSAGVVTAIGVVMTALALR
jgi:nickel/cobalt exporter